MEKRRLGQSSLHIAPLAFGGNVFGWTADEKTSFDLLDAFVAAGFNFIDSADVYSRWHPGNQGGESETILGKWMKARGNRDKVIVATKLGIEMGPGKKGLSRTYMMQAVEASLRRLQTDYIDLYQSHRDDPDTPIEETLSAYGELIKQGKVREIGASNFSAARLAESLRISAAQGLPRYQSLQPQYNLVERRQFEGEIEDLCLKEKLGVISYYSLASGFLTGKYRAAADTEGRARGSRVAKLSERCGIPRSGGAGRCGEALQRDPGADRVGLADRAPQHDRADRQRHDCRSVARDHAGAGDQAGCRRHRANRQGERVGTLAHEVGEVGTGPRNFRLPARHDFCHCELATRRRPTALDETGGGMDFAVMAGLEAAIVHWRFILGGSTAGGWPTLDDSLAVRQPIRGRGYAAALGRAFIRACQATMFLFSWLIGCRTPSKKSTNANNRISASVRRSPQTILLARHQTIQPGQLFRAICFRSSPAAGMQWMRFWNILIPSL